MSAKKTEPSDAVVLDDAMVASLEDYLPGGEKAAGDGSRLQQQILEVLQRLDQRLSQKRNQMLQSDDYQKLVAARQAVQGAQLAMELHETGRSMSHS